MIDPKPEDMPHYDPKQVKQQMKQGMDLDLPASVQSTKYHSSPQHGVSTVYRPGTTPPLVSTEPKDDPRELPTHSVVPTVSTVYDTTPSIYEEVPGAIPGIYAGMPAYLSVPTLEQSYSDISEQ